MGRISLTQNQVHVVIKVSQQRRREIDNFIDVLGQRVNAEETYAKSVEEMAKAADRIRQGEESVSSLGFSCFKFDCVNRSGQSKTFAKCLREEILVPLKELLAEQNQECKDLEKKYKKLEKEFNDYQTQILKIKTKFLDQYKDKQQTLIANEILLQNPRTSKDRRAKTLLKSNDIIQTLLSHQSLHTTLATKYNSFLTEYSSEISRILSTYQSHEETRLARQQQNIMKMLIFQTSMMKNYEYDIVTITTQVEKAKEINEIENFVEEWKTGEEKPREKEEEIEKDMLAGCLMRMNGKSFEKGVMLLGNKEVKGYVERTWRGEEGKCGMFSEEVLGEFREILRIIVSVWQGSPLQLQQTQSIKSLLTDQTNRLIFFLYLQQYLLTSNTLLPAKSSRQITFLLLQVLNICHIHQDIFIARKLTNLTFSFYTLKDQQKQPLHTSFNDCKLYKLIDFWKSSIFESIQQELMVQWGSKSSGEEEYEMRELSLVVGQLAMYCHQMILLGVGNKVVRQIMGYFCRLYGVPEDRNRDLSRTVTMAVKKYQEMFALAETTISVESNPMERKWSLDQIGEPGNNVVVGNSKISSEEPGSNQQPPP